MAPGSPRTETPRNFRRIPSTEPLNPLTRIAFATPSIAAIPARSACTAPQRIASLCGLLVTKSLLSKEELRGLYRNVSENLEPRNDPDIVRAWEVLKEYADSMPDLDNGGHTVPYLIKFPDGRSIRPVDIERVTYNFPEEQTTAVWLSECS